MRFISPLDALGENWAVANANWELVTGAFACQERDCYYTEHEAKYNSKDRILTWKCPEGHTSKLEDYIL